jgi:hypothetical protein
MNALAQISDNEVDFQNSSDTLPENIIIPS